MMMSMIMVLWSHCPEDSKDGREKQEPVDHHHGIHVWIMTWGSGSMRDLQRTRGSQTELETCLYLWVSSESPPFTRFFVRRKVVLSLISPWNQRRIFTKNRQGFNESVSHASAGETTLKQDWHNDESSGHSLLRGRLYSTARLFRQNFSFFFLLVASVHLKRYCSTYRTVEELSFCIHLMFLMFSLQFNRKHGTAKGTLKTVFYVTLKCISNVKLR